MAARVLDVRPTHLEILRTLLRLHLPNAEVWAFGSRTDGTAYDGSDLDLVARHPGDLSVKQPSAFWHLKDALTESRLPFLVDIHDWARIPESFQRGIERGHVVIQAALAERDARPKDERLSDGPKEATDSVRP